MFGCKLINQQLYLGLSFVISAWVGESGWWFSGIQPRITYFSISPAVLPIDHKLSKAL